MIFERGFDLARMLSAVDLVALLLFGAVLLCNDLRSKWGWLRFRKPKTISPAASPAPAAPPVKADPPKVKGVQDIPGPWPSLPVLGTRWIYSLGVYKMDKIHEAYSDMFDRYGPVVREEALWQVPVVSVLERSAIETVLRSSSKYPLRPPTEVTSHYRRSRPDRYTNLGLVNEQGETWHHLRSILTPELTSGKTMLRFLPELNTVASDLTTLLAASRDSNGVITRFEELANRLGLESTCTLILGRRMGFLDDKVDPQAAKLAAAVKVHFCASRDTFYGLPFWKIMPTKAYKELVESEETIYDIISGLVDTALAEEQNTAQVDAVQSVFLAVLNAPGLDVRDKKAAIIDFIAAGIQTLGNTLVFVLYLIAKHPHVQKRLYEELITAAPSGSPWTAQSLRNSPYLRACIMEAFRVLPTAPCVARIIDTDMVLSGYHLNAGSVVLCHTWLAGLKESNFPSAHEYKPERWLNGGPGSAATFLVLPFGCGRRMCPGKRFVEQALQVVVAQTIRDFEVGFEGELGLQFEFLLTPQGPASFTFRDRV
ncbi:hypothetical protein ONE63_007542 [Megalurothrips usitatus]|uniref:Ecdysone 20-monooxygenase n=2 Tax=Megalurothrips usitatus TaxID=439358 RepID=A0AAV7XS91_9NEOP|nr:hypothetical protein ONE63_007542 [Megalurothrips usitatus]